jgi:hypothetical protein
MYLATTISPLLTKILSISFIRKVRGCVKTLAQPLLYFTVLLYFLLAMLLFPHAFGNKLLYSNYIGL